MKFKSICIFIFLSVASFTFGQRDCQTPDNFNGKCVQVTFCENLFRILEHAPQPLPDFVVSYMRRSVCQEGDILEVCCITRYVSNSSFLKPSSTVATTQLPYLTTLRTVEHKTASNDPSLPSNVSITSKISIEDISEPDNSSYATKAINSLNSLVIKDIMINDKTCGIINQNRITRGNRTIPGEFPFMVLLAYTNVQGNKFKCSGSLITPRYVLTAAHCLVNNLVSVRLGEHIISQEKDCNDYRCAPPPIDIDVQETIRHPLYARRNVQNDIGLIRLSRSVPLDNIKYVNTICLPTKEDLESPMNNKRYLVAGWGKTEYGVKSDELLKANIPRQNIELCHETFRINISTNYVICAGGENRVDSCNGDSGGPLFWIGKIKASGARYFQHGITAAGFTDCGHLPNGLTPPAFYTNISSYINWIKKNLQESVNIK